MTYIGVKKYSLEVARGRVSGTENYKKFGGNNDIDTGSTPEDLWNGGGVYTGFNATAGEAIEVFSSRNQDRGTLVSSGTATGGSETTLVDSGATFVTDGVAVDDCIMNDEQQIHGIITAVTSETTLTVIRFENGADVESSHSFASGDAYRVATAASNGAYVVKLTKCIETDYADWLSEYIILNGITAVNSVGTDYIRNSRAIVIAAGAGETTVGALTGRQATTTANVFFVLPQGHDQTLVACGTVPAGYTVYVTAISVSMGRANGSPGSAEIDFDVRPINQVFNTKIHKYITQASPFSTPDDYIQPIPEYADFRFRCDDVSDNNTQVSAIADGYVVINS